MILVFDWINQPGVQSVIKLINNIMNIIRWVVPIGLILMTSWDIFTKVLNPDDKDAQKKIMNRVIAAVIVFFVPVLVRLVMQLVQIGKGNEKIPTSNPSNESKHNNNNNNDTTNIYITNCPNSSQKYQKGDQINLELNKSNNNISWEKYQNDTNLYSTDATLIAESNNKVANITITNSKSEYITVAILNNKKEKLSTCKIYLDKESKPIKQEEQVTGTIEITNCPNKNIYANVGDKITLSADVKNYDKKISWYVYMGKDSVKVNESEDGTKFEIEILNRPNGGFAIITAAVPNNAYSCTINVNK